jgi:hypothetical protein
VVQAVELSVLLVAHELVVAVAREANLLSS